ncbi:MAG: succinate dehydrogenase, cytochrome b556 subunit [Burkholderiales bacterium]|nr:succinate dehydrogenase, cytochrome b556 subunit [Burkholderiales bacterium]MDE1926598.1 succinate dehydrogenase, cytochrome b556 subunit [Burkholderiales bacterium]MDE2159124.1 succinate dehydrogenase, cytochrome b556 subunit [Burkholderiales bacterium]MDE2503720.1 succinate dehydrogenase, cytochrome b556 subunit [Burkholderiales bacterium]
MTETTSNRPGTMHLADALQYRLPVAGLVSILHRASGLILFLLLPFVVWMFDTSITDEVSFERFSALFSGPGGVVAKLVALALIWGFLHHLAAGLRHLWMDATHSVSKEQGRTSAIATLVVSLVLTVLLGAKLFGAF